MEVAWNAALGEARLGPINHTWVSPFQTQPPLFALSSGVWMHLTGALRGDHRPNIQTFRWFSAGCGLLVIVGAHLVGVALASPLLGLLAAALLTFEPWTVMFHRMGLPHNLLALEILATLLVAHRHFEAPRPARLLLATFLASTAPLTVYYGAALPLALIVTVALAGRPRDLWIAPLALAPLALFLAGLWWVHPRGLEADWAQFRLSAAGTWDLRDWAQDAVDLLTLSPLVPLGLLGLALLPRRGMTLLAQLTTLLYLFLWLRRPQNQIWFHRAELDAHFPLITYPLIPLLPLLALGSAQTALLAWRHLRGDALLGQAPAGLWRLRTVSALGALALGGVLAAMASTSLRAISNREPNQRGVPFDHWGFQSPLAQGLAIQKFEALGSPITGPGVATYLWSQGVRPDDLIIAEYPLWWTLPGRKATLSLAIAYLGGPSDFITYPIDHARFAYPCDWRQARFVILDEQTRRWRAEFDREIRAAVREIERNWTEVFSAGRLKVYAPLPATPPGEVFDPFLPPVDSGTPIPGPDPLTPDAASP